MIPARHSPCGIRKVRWMYRFLFRIFFRKVKIMNTVSSPAGSILLIGNHFSWWDGFIAEYLNVRMFRKKFHIMMLEEELRPRMFLNRAGAFSIDKGKRDILESLRYAAGLLNDPANMVVMYPQGRISSIHQKESVFEKGIAHILHQLSPEKLHLVFYAALVDYLSHPRPTLYLYLGHAPEAPGPDAATLAAQYNAFMDQCIRKHIQNTI